MCSHSMTNEISPPGGYTGGVQVYDFEERKRAKLIKGDRERVTSLAFLSDGVLFSSDKGGQLRWLDPESGKCLHVEDVNATCDSAAISPDSKRAVIATEGKLADKPTCWQV